jgi:hypothetical protein
MRPLKLFQEWWGVERKKRIVDGLNSTMIHCEKFAKWHNIHRVQKQ